MELYYMAIGYFRFGSNVELKGRMYSGTIAVLANNLDEASEKIKEIIHKQNQKNLILWEKEKLEKNFSLHDYYIKSKSEVKKCDYMLFDCSKDYSEMEYHSMDEFKDLKF